MKLVKVFLLVVFTGLSGFAQSQESDLQTLVDELQALTDKSKKERAADRWLQAALEALVAKYNFPWSDSLLSDDFADGDYDRDPAWQVDAGEFWVDRRLGLRSQVEQAVEAGSPAVPQKQTHQDLGKALLGAFLQEALGPEQASSPASPVPAQAGNFSSAAIRTAVAIPTTFAVESVFSQNNRPGEAGQFEWVVMQDEQARNAYKVRVSTGRKATVEMIRTQGGQDASLGIADVSSWGDGGEHVLSWRQTGSGEIEVFLDGVSVIKATDKPFRYGFRFLGLTNRSGDFSLTAIEILGGR